MTPKQNLPHVDSPRKEELKKHAQTAKKLLGNLDYIDKIPAPPNRGRIVFPYGDGGKSLPWGSGVWK